MHAREFLRRTVGTEGVYCLFVLERHADGSTGKKRQLFLDTVEELLDRAEDYDERRFDTYFCLATLKDDSGRTVSNALQMRALYLDLDCGEDKANPPDGGNPKGYIDQITALTELRKFCRGYGLPRPLTVNSGRGVHVYWTLDEPVSVEEWLPVARALKAACASRGFLADSAVTSDAVRILRIPGTHNYKADPPAEVEIWEGPEPPAPVALADMAELLGVDTSKPVFTVYRSDVADRMTATQEQLAKNEASRFRRILERTMDGDGCAQLGAMLTNPAAVGEPLWRAGLSIASHCSDSAKAIHAISKGHPDYDPDETEEKAARIKGPYTCVKFDEYNPHICEGCPHWGKVKSPIVLGRELLTAPDEEVTVELTDKRTGITKEYEVPKLPKSYKRGKNGGVYRVVKDEDGGTDYQLVYAHDLYVVRRAYDAAAGKESILVRLHLPQDGVREFIMDLTTVFSKTELVQALAAQGVVAKGLKQWDNIGYYIMDWVEDLVGRTTAATARRQFGWTEEMRSFLIGDREYAPGAVRNNSPTPATQALMSAFQPKGSLDEWVKLISTYNNPGLEVYQLIMGASFGSPLMAFYSSAGVTFHLNGSTGYGKSTLQAAALSVWGNPDELMQADKDTNNIKMHRIEVMKNICVAFDEMTNTAPDDISDFLYFVTQGKQKNRMAGGANVERIRGEPWSLIVLTSANASFYDKLDVLKGDNDAEKARVLELRMRTHVPHDIVLDTPDFERRIRREQFGFAGDKYMRYVVEHQEEVFKLLKEIEQKLVSAVNLVRADRFILHGVTCAITGAMIANYLGLLPYDPKIIFDKAVDILKTRQTELDATKQTADEMLTSYLTENTDRILRIDSTQKKGVGGGASLVVPDTVAKGQLVARYEPDVGKLYLLPRPLRTWCATRQINYEAFLTSLGEIYPLHRNVQVRLERGTAMEPLNARVSVLEMDSVDGSAKAVADRK